VEASIREYGILDPVTINSADVIVDGHLRVEIARKLGFRTVPAIRIAHLSDAELRAYAIAANKLPAVANYDVDALRIELEEIKADAPALDLTLTGFTIGEVDRIAGNHAATRYDDLDDDEPPPTEIAVARRGDLYSLGEHQLICGDSLLPGTYERLLGADEVDCCFTDPPYNVKGRCQTNVTSAPRPC
jgi:ParB-like chromosome segregation protein Spo0J